MLLWNLASKSFLQLEKKTFCARNRHKEGWGKEGRKKEGRGGKKRKRQRKITFISKLLNF